MTILAGFDLVLEINSKVIEDAIASTPFGGTTLSPPAEVVVGDTTNGIDAILLDPVTFSLGAGTNGISISIPFDETTVYYNGQAVGPVKGVLQLNGTIDQFETESTNKLFDIGLLLPPTGVSIDWDSGSYTQNALGTLSSSDRASMESNIKTATWLAISNNKPSAGISFNEDDSKDGLLGKTGLRFRSVTVQNINSTTIGLFCMMLVANDTPSSVVRSDPGLPGPLGAAMSLSGACFQKLIFCPAITESLVSKFDPSTQTPDQFAAIVNSQMPSGCGTADYVPLSGGLKLTNISSSLETGYVQVNGTAIQGKTDVYCFRLVANFDTQLSFSVSKGAISASINPNPPHIVSYVDVSWFCFLLYFAAALAASPITALLAIWILISVEWLAFTFVPVLAPGLNVGLGATEQVGLNGFTLSSIDVLPERFTLLGTVAVKARPAPGPVRGIVLALTNDITTDQQQIGGGTYHFPGSKFCKAKDYSYTESTDEEQITYTATPHFLGQNPSYKWTLGGVLLTGTSGEVALSVAAAIPEPGDLTMNLGFQNTTVSYLFTNSLTVPLTGQGAFNYGVTVQVEADTTTGFVATDSAMAVFTNHTIQMLDDWDSDMAKCKMASEMAINLLRTIPQAIPRGGDGPDYMETVQVLREAVLQGRAGAQEGVMEGVRVYGSQLIEDILRSAGEG